jgi:hypothetical protein
VEAVAQDVISINADPRLSNVLMAVKIMGEAAALLLTLQMLDQLSNGVPPAAVFWDRVRAGAQHMAFELGRLGMHAENRYQEVVKK